MSDYTPEVEVIAPSDEGIDSARRAHMARSSLIVMAAFVLSKVVGLLRERAIGHQFGISAEYDAYVAAFRVPDLLFTLIAGGALISAFLPVFAGALTRGDDEEGWRLASAVTNLVFLTTAVLAAVAALAAPLLTAELAPGFDPEQQALTVDLMRIILVSTIIFSFSGIQMGILNAYQHFLTPALAPIVYNVGILAGAIFLAPRFGIHGLAWGVVLGAALHLLVKVPALLRRGFRWMPLLDLRSPGVRRVLWLMWPRVLAMGTVQAIFLINVRLASQVEAGSVAALNYAWVISQMPQTILGTAIATVAFPTLAELSARGALGALRDTAVEALRIMIALSMPAATALAILAGPVVAVLLQTGRFDAAAAAATQLALAMFALGLIGHVTLEVVARTYYAQQDTLTPLYVGGIAMLINIALAYALVGPLAQGGLALANSVAVTIEVILALWILHRRWNGVRARALADTTLRAGVSAAVMAAAMFAVIGILPPAIAMGPLAGPLIDGLVRITAAGTIGALVYFAAALLLGLDEVRVLTRLLVRLLGRGRRASAGG